MTDYYYDPLDSWEANEDITGYLMDEWLDGLNGNRKDGEKWSINPKKNRNYPKLQRRTEKA